MKAINKQTVLILSCYDNDGEGCEYSQASWYNLTRKLINKGFVVGIDSEDDEFLVFQSNCQLPNSIDNLFEYETVLDGNRSLSLHDQLVKDGFEPVRLKDIIDLL